MGGGPPISSKTLKFLGCGGGGDLATAAAKIASSAAFSEGVGGDTFTKGIGAPGEKPVESVKPSCC